MDGERKLMTARAYRWGLLGGVALVVESRALAYTPPVDGVAATVEWLNTFRPEIPKPHHATGAGAEGGAEYSFPLTLPPAIVAPGLSLVYNSTAGLDRDMAYGWHIEGIASLARPNDAQAFREGELRYASPSASGILRPGGVGDWRLSTTGTGETNFSYDGALDSWKADSTLGGTWTLEGVDDGGGTYVGTSLWRGTHYRDTSGNCVDITYDDHGRLDEIQYGGNCFTGDAHLVRVIFGYDAGPTHTNARGGFVDELGGAISQIFVDTRPDGGSAWAPARYYRLDLSESGGFERLDDIVSFGMNDDGTWSTEPATSFTYSDYSGGEERENETVYPFDDLGLTFSGNMSPRVDGVDPHCDDGGLYSWTQTALIDMNGDGLPDYVDAGTDGDGDWSVYYQLVDPVTLAHSWSTSPVVYTGLPEVLNLFHTSSGLTRQYVRLTDLDGDGLQDVIDTRDAGACTTGTANWHVYYGNGDGFDPPVTEAAIDPQVEIRSSDISGSGSVGISRTLVDVDGDGFLDYLTERPQDESVDIYYHAPARGGGWSATPVSVWAPWAEDLNASESYFGGMSQHVVVDFDSVLAQIVLDVGGFADLNGDGLLDYVLSAQAGTLLASSFGPTSSVLAEDGASVYLGNGSGWEPWRRWQHGPNYLRAEDPGYDTPFKQVILNSLMDVDGDGLVDEVDEGEGDFWRQNLGDDESSVHGALPVWKYEQGQESADNLIAYDYGGGWPCTEYGDCNAYYEKTTFTYRDIDHDGALDSVDLSVASHVHYGAYPRPNRLISVDVGNGLVTDMTYAPSGEIDPSGDPSMPQYLHSALDVVSEISSTDTVTGRSATTGYDYRYGREVGGVFRGFGQRIATNHTSEHRWQRTEEVYYLDLDQTPIWPPLLALAYTYSDDCLISVPASTRCSTYTPHLRFSQSYTYGDFGSHRLVEHYSETDDGDEVIPETTKSITVDYDYDDWGNPTLIEHNGGPDGTSAAKTIEIRYIEEGANPPTMVRPSDEIVSGWDALSSTWRQERWTQYWYDDLGGSGLTDGLLTRVDSLAWLAEAGQTPSSGGAVTVEYDRDDRGQVTTVTEQPQGSAAETTLTWAFGDAVLASETTPTRAYEYTVDDRGRRTSVQDLDNLVEDSTTFDGFDRPVERSLTGTDGVSHLVSVDTYDHASVPFIHSRTIYGSSGAAEAVNHEVLDGGGSVTQSWKENALGTYDVTDIAHDLWGATLSTTRGYNRAVFAWTGFGGSGGTQKWYDGIGVERAYSRDLGAGGLVLTEAHPWTLRTTDEAGYQTEVARDAFGRVVRVSQGQQGSIPQTATYQYDSLDRLIRYTDAVGNHYDDVYDGAGRLRRVRGADLGQVEYGYDGADRTTRTDTGGATATWHYDLAHRPVTLAVSDPLLGTANYAWAWDTTWAGAIDTTTDPTGATTTDYDNLGHPDELHRTWTSGQTATYTLTTDVQGRVTSETTPGGHTVGTTWSHGWPIALTESSATLASLSYDAQGQASQLTASSGGLQIDWTYAAPGLPSQIDFHQGSTHLERDYTWYADGLMHTVNDLAGATTYAYDAQRRLASATGPRAESWTWDLAGNPQTIHTFSPSHNWTYTRGVGSEMASRQDGATLETFSWDGAGRLSNLTNGGVVKHYEYDGLGRLRRATTNGAVQLVADYDADGNITRRASGNPALPTTPLTYQFRNWSYRSNVAQSREELDLGGMPVGDYDGTTRRWYFTEFGGHVAAVTANNGSILGQRTNAVFGASITRSGFPPAFRDMHGELQDAGTDLYLVGPRAFAPDSGQWLQPDPMMLDGLRGARLGDPQGLAPYRYARNAPTAWADRSGRNPVLVAAAGAEVVADVVVVGGVVTLAAEAASTPEGQELIAEVEASPIMAEGAGLAEEAEEVIEQEGASLVDRAMGQWVNAREYMSARAAAYQDAVTGRMQDMAYRVAGVKFDGVKEKLIETKGPGYDRFIDPQTGTWQPWFTGAQKMFDQAQRQVAAANGAPIEWRVAEERSAALIGQLLSRFPTITVVWDPTAVDTVAPSTGE